MTDGLLLLSLDELHILWDALMRHRVAIGPCDPDFDELLALIERVENLRRRAAAGR